MGEGAAGDVRMGFLGVKGREMGLWWLAGRRLRRITCGRYEVEGKLQHRCRGSA